MKTDIDTVLDEKKSFFGKYKKSGHYHWSVLSINPFSRNLIHLGRYQMTKYLLGKELYGLSGKSILDMGCGDGVLSYLIGQSGGIVSGVDLCEFAIKYAKKQLTQRKISVDLSVQDVCSTMFSGDTFDAVVLNEVIEHLLELEKMLLEIKRVLRLGGVAIISTPIRVTKHPLDQYHVNEWFHEDFKNLVVSVFPGSKYKRSHPIFLTDTWYRTKLGRIIMQIISIFHNPMCYESSEGLFRQQYAILRKT